MTAAVSAFLRVPLHVPDELLPRPPGRGMTTPKRC
jgi:hypothetical protein